MNYVRSAKLVSALALLLFAGAAFAQSDLGSISGFVKDPSGATIPRAQVIAKNQTGLERQATTNESGYYIITNVPPGIYSISVEAPGFKKFGSTGNKLDPAATLSTGSDSCCALSPSRTSVSTRSVRVWSRIVTRHARSAR